MEHSKEFLSLVGDAKGRVSEVSVAEALERIENGATLIDDEHATPAKHMSRGIIERDVVKEFPDKHSEMILYCGGGFRSALAADLLQNMGYTNVWSMAGGWTTWKEADAPTETPIPS